MKKLVTAIATTTFVFTGVAALSVSAEEYEVQEQDTLWGIADEYDTSVQSLQDLNGIESTIIHPGQIITTDGEDEKTTESYTVEKGDTLSHISNKYGVTVDEVMEWNDLSSTLILVGQELEIQTKTTEETSSNEVVENKEPEVEEEPEVEVEEEPEAEETSNEQASESTSQSEGETMTVTATAYTAECEGCTGITATGIDLNADRNKKVIAVDPDVIPLGSEVHVEGYGTAIAGDVGGAIKGDKIDVHVSSKEEANSWGVQTVEITVLD